MARVKKVSDGFLDAYKDHPFTVACALSAAGLAAWFGSEWWVIALALLLGLFVGITVEAGAE